MIENSFHIDSSCILNFNDVFELSQTQKIVEFVKPYFLAPYEERYKWDKATRWIDGTLYTVERANHGLAHSLRQGSLAKDIFELLILLPSSEISDWARKKASLDPQFIFKIELASSFQRSGRQSEISSADNLELYKQYELQDTVNFRKQTENFSIFPNALEHRVFEESILWSNQGTLNESDNEDLKFLRRILHAAHTLDLRRITGFDGNRIQKDMLSQLFGEVIPSESDEIASYLWDRSGAYLAATGDGDLVDQRHYQDHFFTRTPGEIAVAIHQIRKEMPLGLQEGIEETLFIFSY